MPEKCRRSVQISWKCLKYEEGIFDVEKRNFVPLVLSCIGLWEAGPSVTCIKKQPASKIAEKKDESYSDAITYVRTRIRFALMRCAILCLRGRRGSKRSLYFGISCSAVITLVVVCQANKGATSAELWCSGGMPDCDSGGSRFESSKN